jgi:hypothetical protein
LRKKGKNEKVKMDEKQQKPQVSAPKIGLLAINLSLLLFKVSTILWVPL